MLKKILAVLAIIIIIVLAVALTKPNEFRVSRSITIDAPMGTVFENVNDLHKWQAWSPWAKMDPDAKTEFSGPQSGMGASMSWDGEKTGQGRMTITDSEPGKLVRFSLEFFKPMEGVNTAEFTFEENDRQITVNWTMFGPMNFMNKIMSVFMDCDKMVGEQFEQGLASLKSVAESAPE